MARDPQARQRFVLALDEMAEAMLKLENIWNELPSDDRTMDAVSKSYPFHLSFDELAFKVVDWRNSVRGKLARGPKDWRPERRGR